MGLPGLTENAVFFILATIAVLGAYGLVKAPKVAHSLLYLSFTFLSVGFIFIMIGAEFIGLIQILVYYASVGLVVLFGIMLTRRQILEEDFE